MISKKEGSFQKFLDDNGVSYLHNDRQALPKRQELDFYLPKYSLAFELNPTSSHGEFGLRNTDALYHQNKAISAREKNIKLTHIYDWTDSLDGPIWTDMAFSMYFQSLILPREKLATKIETIDDEEGTVFIEENDIFKTMLSVVPEIYYGVFENDLLIAVLVGESGSLSKRLNDALTYRYVGIPGFRISNFWEVWGKTHLILTTSLDYIQTIIPLENLNYVYTTTPNIYLCKGTGRKFKTLSLVNFIESQGSWILDGDWRYFANKENYQIIHDAGNLVLANYMIV